MGDSTNGYLMRESCGENYLVERTHQQLKKFGRDGRIVEGGRGDRDNSRDGSRMRMNALSQRDYRVRVDGRDGRVGESCGEDVS